MSPPVDRLSVLLRSINVRSAVYCLSKLREPWGFRVDASPEAKFHIVLGGHAWLRVAGDDVAALSAGDVVLLPHGTEHLITDRAGSAAPSLADVIESHPVDGDGRLSYGGSGPRTVLLCGAFEVDANAGLLRALPRSVVLESPGAGIDHWLEPMSALLRARPRGSPKGAAAVVAKIADVFLTDVLRSYLAAGGMEAISVDEEDPAISEALQVLRGAPAQPWTVAALARQVGMSRTAFAARFRLLVGEPPMAYLTKLRLSQAAGYLATSTKGIAQIARLVGFADEASFSKAFKRVYGQSPSSFRRGV